MTGERSARESTVAYLWFWTFWHWSRESHRSGAVLRDPIHGIAGHWDEWFRHEATERERAAVANAGETASAQRRFVEWLVRCWSREAHGGAVRPPVRFVLGQLAQVAPFDGWFALRRYRAGYGAPGISAIVLSEDSRGEAADVREIDAIAVPADAESGAEPIVPEGFRVDAGDLLVARQAVDSVLDGRGLLAFLARWIATGRRPYSRRLGAVLRIGWLAIAALIVYLVVGPDPGERVVPLTALLVAGWAALAVTGLTVAGWVTLRAWRQGREWRTRLAHAQVRLRMNTGLTHRGASAGLPFALNVLLSLYRSRPRAARGAWLWHRAFRGIGADPHAWAATGVLTPDGRVEPVVLEQKLRASLHHARLRDVLAPRQREASSRAVARMAVPAGASSSALAPGASDRMREPIGHAREASPLRVHQCRSVAQSLLAIGGMRSRGQIAANVLALSVSAVMLAALPGVRSILWPPPPPLPVAQPSASPYQLWVSVDSRSPESFYVALESDFWANRRVRVERHDGVGGTMRAELRLRRLMRPGTNDVEDGTVWVERRRHFLSREFAPGDRVGRYFLSYLIPSRHDSLP